MRESCMYGSARGRSVTGVPTATGGGSPQHRKTPAASQTPKNAQAGSAESGWGILRPTDTALHRAPSGHLWPVRN
jgi:hypothetical protein